MFSRIFIYGTLGDQEMLRIRCNYTETELQSNNINLQSSSDMFALIIYNFILIDDN